MTEKLSMTPDWKLADLVETMLAGLQACAIELVSEDYGRAMTAESVRFDCVIDQDSLPEKCYIRPRGMSIRLDVWEGEYWDAVSRLVRESWPMGPEQIHVNDAFKCLHGEGLIEVDTCRTSQVPETCVELTWDGECIVESLSRCGGFRKIAESIDLKPSGFGPKVDLKRLIAAILSR